MDKKKIIIHISIFLACFFLLAHSVMPHAHHDGTICLIEEQTSSSSSSSCCYSGCEVEAQHHHHENVEECDLKEYIIRETNSDISQPHFSLNLLSAYCFVHYLDATCLNAPYIKQKLPSSQYYQIYISPFVSSTSGLRAPPVSSFLA